MNLLQKKRVCIVDIFISNQAGIDLIKQLFRQDKLIFLIYLLEPGIFFKKIFSYEFYNSLSRPLLKKKKLPF